MRKSTIELNEKQYEVGMTFGAGEYIRQHVADPLVMSRDYMMTALMEERGHAYNSKYPMTLHSTVRILYAGIKAANPNTQLSEIEDAVMDHGPLNAAGLAMEYLAELVGIGPEEKMPKEAEGESSGE